MRQDAGFLMDFSLGVHSCSFKKLHDLSSLVRAIQETGLTTLELWPGHLSYDLPQVKIKEAAAMLATGGIRISSWGIFLLGKDEAGDRLLFRQAGLMGVQTIGCDLAPEDLKRCSKAAEGYGVKLAIHNSSMHTFWKTVHTFETAFVNGENVGACVDTGEFLRNGEDPVFMLQKFPKRIFGVHLKDVRKGRNGRWEECPLGTGILPLKPFLRELAAINFTGYISLEYERTNRNGAMSPAEAVKQSAEAVYRNLSR